jgi:hypothetical protein
MNGELARSDEPLKRHIERCRACQQTAERLENAEAALTGVGGEAPPEEVRRAWLDLVEQERPSGSEPSTASPRPALAAENGASPEREPSSAAAAPESTVPRQDVPAADLAPLPDFLEEPLEPVLPSEPTPESARTQEAEPGTVRARARRGGVVGAARRLAASARRHQ